MGWYITILQEMRETLGLKGNELLVYAVIYGYSQEGQGCFYGSLSHLAEICGITTRTAITTLQSLQARGYILKSETIHNGVKYIAYTINGKIFTGSEKISQGGGEKISHNIEIDGYINNSLSIKGRGKFQKPSVEEVAAYCAERGNKVDAQAFCDFYESKGWKVGNSAMKDWRACVRTWERRDERPTPSAPSPRGGRRSAFTTMTDMLNRTRGAQVAQEAADEQ